jgi:hypothetical protein
MSSEDASRPREIQVVCPCCQTELLVDVATAAVLREDRKKRPPTRSFEEAVKDEQERRKASDEVFGKALQGQRTQQEILERKFQEAMKKAEEDPESPPPRPVDWD